MDDSDALPVVVGIDGSAAALHAAQWAARDAAARDTLLRLVFAASSPRTQGEPSISDADAYFGEEVLREAAAAVEAAGEPIKVTTDVIWGPPSNVLVAESRRAALTCVGTVGIGALSQAIVGSTAMSVARRAHGPVAVIRPPLAGEHAHFVAVGVDESASMAAVDVAAKTARAHGAPLIAVGLGCNAFGVNSVERTEALVEDVRRRYPELRIDVIGARAGLAEFLAENRHDLARRYAWPRSAVGHPHPVAVVDDVDHVLTLVGPADHAVRAHAFCSVVVWHG